MNSKTISYGILRALAFVVGFVVFCYFVYEIQSVLLYIAIAAVIALIGRPMVIFMRTRLKLPNQLAVVITLLFVTSVIIGLFALFIPVILQQSENLGKINIENFKTNLNELNVQIRDYLGVKQIDLIQTIRHTNFVRNFDFKIIPKFMGVVFGQFGAAIIGIFAVIFISFFFLKDSGLMLQSILVFSQKGEEDRFKRVFNKIKNLLSRYFVGLTLQIFVLFVLYTILLFVFKVQNPIAAAFICAFLNIVPYLGPTVAGILMMLFVTSSHLGSDFSTVILPNLLYVLAGYAVCQLIDNFVTQPIIFGKSVKSHPLEIFLVIVISGLLFSVLGMILAIPFYTALKVIAKEAFSEYKIVKKLTRGM